MPLTIQPPGVFGSAASRAATAARPDQILIALVNNMPDSALESTAAQFARLLGSAAGPLSVQLRIGYLAEVPRGPDAEDHIRGTCWHIDEMFGMPLDAMIVTGTEPRAARLQEEPYWSRFERLLNWADLHMRSSVWSCLAAHAAVQILDGIERRSLGKLRESRRDVSRFLRGQQTQYPALPLGSFSADVVSRLMAFQERACAAPSPELLSSFPVDVGAAVMSNTWGAAAVQIYRNWLTAIAAKKNHSNALFYARS